MSMSNPKYYKKSKFLERFYLVLIIKHHVFVPKNNNILKRLDLLNYSINICILIKAYKKWRFIQIWKVSTQFQCGEG
jgi:hypothetical protein